MSSDFGGQLRVVLNISDGCVNGVEIFSTRPQDAAHVFIGRSPEVVVSTVGLLFSLCGTAQTIASLQAVEDALDLTVSSPQSAARDMMRRAEMLSQTMLRLCVDWRILFGLDVQPDLVRTCLNVENELEQALFQGTAWKTPGPMTMAPDLDKVKSILESLQTKTKAYNDGPADELRQALKTLDLKVLGPDLAHRLNDRLVNLTRLPIEMLKCQKKLGEGKCFDLPAKSKGQGQATVDTVRGPLTHRLTIKNSLIQSYDILAPTDINFAPDGPVVSGLLGLKIKDESSLKQAAELYVLAIDPCVECKVEIINA